LQIEDLKQLGDAYESISQQITTQLKVCEPQFIPYTTSTDGIDIGHPFFLIPF